MIRISPLSISLIIFISTAAQGLLAQDSAISGDIFYVRGDYVLARLEYERALLSPMSEEKEDMLIAKSGLSLLRTDKFRESVLSLRGDRSFSVMYLRMYASFRAGYVERALIDQGKILDSAATQSSQKGRAKLLGGSVYLDSGDFPEAERYYTQLQKDTEDEIVQRLCGSVLTSMSAYTEISRKNQILAGFFSAVLPGSGQLYAGHTADALSAFFFNSMFIGSASVIYNLENRAGRSHTASGIFGFVALIFYLSNITGAIAAASQTNVYNERKFQSEIREKFFNLDYVQDTSGISFITSY